MRTAQAAMYSFIVSCYFGCFYFGIGTLMTLAQHQDMGKFLSDFVVIMLVFFVGGTFAIKELRGAFDEINKPRKHNVNSDSGKDEQPPVC